MNECRKVEVYGTELMQFQIKDNYDNYLRNNHLAPYLGQLVMTTNWTLGWHRVASVKVSDGGFRQIRSHRYDH